MRKYTWAAACALALVATLSCEDVSDPSTPGIARISLHVETDPRIAAATVDVTAPDITVPLGFALSLSGGVATGTIEIPVGAARTITVHAFDATGLEIFRGSVTVDIHTGTNPTAHILLLPATGDQPIVGTISRLLIHVTPANPSVHAGQAVQLTANVTDAGGHPLTGFHVAWMSRNPAFASVDANGLVTGLRSGHVEIVATLSGAAGVATIDVQGVAHSLAVGGDGADHACGLNTAGAAYCWVFNHQGQLGDGTTDHRGVPTAVVGGLTFSDIGVGAAHTCAITPAGGGYCWGFNDLGALGTANNVSSHVPVPVSGGLTFSSITVGNLHTCALTTAGAAYCWGWNPFGQLGEGTTTDQNTPVAVLGGLTFRTISAGATLTCGLTTSGAAYCWGQNASGQLGDGTNTESHSPAAVSGGHSFVDLDVGFQQACAITESGVGYCWGRNGFGALGDGTTADRSTPVQVAGGLRFASISSGGGLHSCGVTTGNVGYCWGSGILQVLGTGSTADQLAPAPVAGGLAFRVISAGSEMSCGITTAGAGYCWGRGVAGAAIGDGVTTASSSPVAVTGGVTFR